LSSHSPRGETAITPPAAFWFDCLTCSYPELCFLAPWLDTPEGRVSKAIQKNEGPRNFRGPSFILEVNGRT